MGAFLGILLSLLLVTGVGPAEADPATPAPAPPQPAASSAQPHASATAAAQRALPDLQGRGHTRSCGEPAPGHATCFAEILNGVASGTATPNSSLPGYTPQDIQSAYALPAGGAGATVAVVDAFDLPTAESDLGVYRQRFGLPACTTANGCFRKVDQSGGISYPVANSDWGAETALDIEMVSAACPACKILLVEAASDLMTDMGAAVNTAVALGAKYVTNSYGAQGTGLDLLDTTYFNHPGVVITASSGDGGFGSSNNPQFPASSPHVTAVGGTTLTPAAGTYRGWAETAWSGAGSGCSTFGAKPAWQHDGGCPTKTVADVSAVADPNTGVAAYTSSPTSSGQSGWLVFGGTSVSSPLIAGMYALAGAPAAGSYPAEYPYQHVSALNDVTSGSNGSCSPSYQCTAGPGYDGPTGLGTPNGVSAFAASGTTPAPPAPSLAKGDFNSDGHADVLARDGSGYLYSYRGNGSGGWIAPTQAQVGTGWNMMTAIVSPGDFNGDGHNDVIARDSSGLLWLYPGDGAQGWGPRVAVGSGWNVMSTIVAPGDFTGDGNPDLLAVDGAGTLWLYPGNGRGGWLPRQAIGTGWASMSAIVGIGDFDGDGSNDLLARNGSGQLWLYAHSASGWRQPVVVGTGWNVMTSVFSVGDFNGDGHPDLLARNSSGALLLYPGNGNSGWGQSATVGSGWGGMTWLG